MSSASIPPGWNKTHEDLAAEMKRGERPSIGQAEMDWATQYEQSLLPPDIRFPKVGEIYAPVRDIDVQFEIYLAAPITNSGTGKLLKGERVRITFVSPDDQPITAFAAPLQYRAVERRFVEEAVREPPYMNFRIVLKTTDLHASFRPIRRWTLRNLTLRAADFFRRHQVEFLPLFRRRVPAVGTPHVPTNVRCSFCSKTQDQVRKLIAGPDVYICDECIELCNDIILEETEIYHDSLLEASAESSPTAAHAMCALCHFPSPMAHLTGVPDRGFLCDACVDAIRIASGPRPQD